MSDPVTHHGSRQRRLSVALAVLAAAGVMAISELSYRFAKDALHGLHSSHAARLDARVVSSLLADAETAQRGFLLTGRENYLAPMKVSEAALPEIMSRLAARYTDTESARLLARLDQASQQKLSELRLTIELYRKGSHQAWQGLMSSDIGRERIEAVRAAATALEAREGANLSTDRVAVLRALVFGRFGVLALTVLSLLWLLYFLRKNEVLHQVRQEHAQELRAERDRLEGEVRQRTAELTDLAQHLTRVRENQSEVMARELHDELGALLTAAKLDVARVRRLVIKASWSEIDARLEHMSQLLDEGISLKRRIIEDLRPSALFNLGLTTALEILVREVAERSGLTVHTNLSEVVSNVPERLAIYRLVHETLGNVSRHAGAQTAWLCLAQEGNEMVISIRDDGRGYDTGQAAAGSHGLIDMRYRIESLGGTLRLNSVPGQGTEVEARFPLASALESAT